MDGLSELRDQALRKTRGSLSQKARNIKSNLQEITTAVTSLVAAGSSAEALDCCSQLLHVLLSGEVACIVARLLVVSYYINLVYTQLETWHMLRSPAGPVAAAGGRWRDGSAGAPSLLYPHLYLWGLLPVAVMAGAGVVVPWLFSAVLFVFILCQDAWITWVHIKAAVTTTKVPSELLMKQLALIGSAALLLAHSVRDSPRLRHVTAGLLFAGDDDQEAARPGVRRSTVLLLGRLLLAALLIYAGHTQVVRISNRAQAARLAAPTGRPIPTTHHYGRADPHDNTLLLVECLLAIPLALGLFTTGVPRLISAVLLIEAVTQWGWWGGEWPSWHYRQHIREHFFLNLSVAGGLLLMQSVKLGGGLFAVDSLLAKQD